MKIFRTLARSARNVRDFFAAERVVVAPFTRDLRSYDMPKFRADAWAAANVTALALAQAIAFAAIAGLPVVYGIVSTAVAAFVAPLFAGSRHTILGPTNATAFMLFSFFAAKPMLVGRWNELIPLLVLMVGLMAVVGALFRLADLLQYVSRSVLVGYISGAAVLIVANQLKPFLGLGGVLDAGTGRVGRQMATYSLNALLAEEVRLETPTIKEANGTFARSEMESAFSWLCNQAKETRFDLQKIHSIEITGDKAQVELALFGLVELPTYRPADGNYDVTFYWQKEEDGWRLTRATWNQVP